MVSDQVPGTHHGAFLAARRALEVIGPLVSDTDRTGIDVDVEEVHVHDGHGNEPVADSQADTTVNNSRLDARLGVIAVPRVAAVSATRPVVVVHDVSHTTHTKAQKGLPQYHTRYRNHIGMQ